MTNALTQRYLAEFAKNGPPVSEFMARVRPAVAEHTFLGRTLTRAGFLERAEVERLDTDLENLYRCLSSLPNRLFGGDLGAFAASTGLSPQQVSAIVRGQGSAPSRMARADLYIDDTGFRVMEINMTAALGGLDNMMLNRAMLQDPFMAEFAEANKLGYVDTMAEMVQTLRIECGVPDGVRPVVAITDWPASYPNLETELRGNARVLGKLGIDAYPCHIGQLRLENDEIWLEDKKIEIIYRLFLIEDLMDESGPALIDPLLQAAERSNIKIFSPMDSEIYSSKSALAMLSDETNRHLFSAEELESLDRFLPWTRMVRTGPVTIEDGSTVQLEQYALDQRTELILKPTLMHGGQGVIPGWQTEPDEWRQRIEAAVGEQFILQKRIHPTSEPFPSETGEGNEDWMVLWGGYLGANGYSGMFLRGTNRADAGVLNIATGAIASCCFHEL
jgi:hypothetical protein